MTGEYVTSEEHLPSDLNGEVTLQVTDAETRAIFTTRARIAQERSQLAEPEPLTVVRGPHENIKEEWFIDILETNVEEGVDHDLLAECVDQSRTETNVINTRSEDIHALLTYLVETGEFDSRSDAVRSLLKEALSQEYPDLVRAYLDRKSRLDRDELADSLPQ